MNRPASFACVGVVAQTLLFAGVLTICDHRLSAEAPPAVLTHSGRRIVFLGDSITAAGHYLDDIETSLLLRDDVSQHPVLIGLGLSSETVSGLTEPDHPFPRPCIHERLARVLRATKPEVVVACYGINDAIYHPFSEDRFTAFREGMLRLIREVRAAGARVVLLTPPPYAGSVAPLSGPQAGEPFGYKSPDPEYDHVLARYATWVLSLDAHEGVAVIDIRMPLLEHLAEAYTGDPIHPNLWGHRLMAQAVLTDWKKIVPDSPAQSLSMPASETRWTAIHKLVSERRRIFDQTLLREIGHERPGTPPTITFADAQQEAARLGNEIHNVLQEN